MNDLLLGVLVMTITYLLSKAENHSVFFSFSKTFHNLYGRKSCVWFSAALGFCVIHIQQEIITELCVCVCAFKQVKCYLEMNFNDLLLDHFPMWSSPSESRLLETGYKGSGSIKKFDTSLTQVSTNVLIDRSFVTPRDSIGDIVQ